MANTTQKVRKRRKEKQFGKASRTERLWRFFVHLDLVHTHECGIKTEFAKFISWEYIDDIFIAVCTEDVGRDCGFGVFTLHT